MRYYFLFFDEYLYRTIIKRDQNNRYKESFSSNQLNWHFESSSIQFAWIYFYSLCFKENKAILLLCAANCDLLRQYTAIRQTPAPFVNAGSSINHASAPFRNKRAAQSDL